MPRADPTAPATLLQDFLGRYFHDPAVGLLRAAEAELVAARPLPRPLLDLGTGDGYFTARVLAAPATVGVDRDWRRLRRARASGGYRHVVVADAHRLPFRDQSFAAVLSNSTLEHIPGAGDVLRECGRVLRPEGRLLFTLHNQRFAENMFFWPRLFRFLGRPRWSDSYRSARLRRLAMANLLSEADWRSLSEASGLEVCETRGYLGGRAERAFEALLVLGRFGLGRANIGSLLRLLGQSLDRIGLSCHRRLLGRVLASLLEAAARDASGPPAALLVVARRPPETAQAPGPAATTGSRRPGEPDAGIVVDFEDFRRRTG